MHDWPSYVRERLSLPTLRTEREREIVEELAARLDEFYNEAISNGAREDEAVQYARERISNWDELRAQSNRTHLQPRAEKGYLNRESAALDQNATSDLQSIFSDLLFDLLYGFRILKKHPGFLAVALITLALGIGVNTALYSLFDAWWKLPNRLEEPETLAYLWYRSPGHQRSVMRSSDYLDLLEQSNSFAQMAAFTRGDRVLAGRGEPERVRVVAASANLWSMLGFSAQIGRIAGRFSSWSSKDVSSFRARGS